MRTTRFYHDILLYNHSKELRSQIYVHVCHNIVTEWNLLTDVTCETGTPHPSGVHLSSLHF